MLMPTVFGENMLDDFMMPFGRDFDREFFGRRSPLYGKRGADIMKTDIRENEGNYELAIDLPGFKKEDLQLQLDNGMLTIRASKGLDKDEKDKDGNYVRRERYAGSCSRSFYVGEGVTEEDIHAKLEDGILNVSVPKKDAKALPEKKMIAIEG